MIHVLKVLLIGIFFDMRFRTPSPEINVNVNQGGRRLMHLERLRSRSNLTDEVLHEVVRRRHV